MKNLGLGLLLLLTVARVFAVPVVGDDVRETPQGFPITVNVLGNDVFDSTSTVVVTALSSPENGTIQINQGDNSIIYVPNANFTGTDSFDYQVTDIDGSASGTVTIVVVTLAALIDRPNSKTLAAVIDVMCPTLFDADEQDLSAGQVVLKDRCNELFTEVGLGGDVGSVLNALANEQLPAQRKSLEEFTRSQTNSVESRMQQLKAGVTGFSVAGLSITMDGQTLTGAQIQQLMNEWRGGNAGETAGNQRWSLFVNGNINESSQDATQLEAGFDQEGLGLTFGADYRLNAQWIAGFALGLNRSDVDFGADAGSSETESLNYIFYSTYYQGDWSFDALVGFGFSNINSDRRVQYTAGGSTVDTFVGSDTEGDQQFVSLTTYYQLESGALTINPYVAVDWNNNSIDGFTETNAEGWEQTIRDRREDSLVFSLGAKFSYVLSYPWGVLVPHGGLVYEYETDGDADPITSGFLYDPNDAEFDYGADEADTNYAVANIGFSSVLPHGLSLFIDYEKFFAYKNYEASQWTVGGRWELTF